MPVGLRLKAYFPVKLQKKSDLLAILPFLSQKKNKFPEAEQVCRQLEMNVAFPTIHKSRGGIQH
jgi:hypothetical protein